jgi:quinol monooxygenase YgiN
LTIFKQSSFEKNREPCRLAYISNVMWVKRHGALRPYQEINDVKHFAIRTGLLALALTIGMTSAKANDAARSELALFLTIKTQPGQRDALIELWDEHLKTRASENIDHVSYVFALDMNDPDTVRITEVYATQAAFDANTQAPWFGAYMAEAGQLLAGEPEFAMARPYWVK